MATQRVLLVQEIGQPLVLVHDRPIPEPGRGQLLIKVTVAGKSDQCRDPKLTSGRHSESTCVLTFGNRSQPTRSEE
jgi:hypothetical protein